MDDSSGSSSSASSACATACCVTMAGQGHAAMLTAPDLFATEVLGLLHTSG